MKRAILLSFLLVPSIALAQQQPPASPTEQALGAKLMREINDGLTCGANVVALQAEVQRLQAKIKEIEAKPEDAKK